MEIRIVILSLACFSCLVPPAFTAPILVTKALAAVGALKGAAVLGAGAVAAAVAKGAVVKGLAAKGALIGLGVKALKAKAAAAALALPRPALVQPPLVLEKPVMIQPVAYPVPLSPKVVLSPPRLSNIMDKLGGLLAVSKDAVINKTAAAGELLSSLMPSKTVVAPPQPVVYEVVSQPKYYPLPMPVIEKVIMK